MGVHQKSWGKSFKMSQADDLVGCVDLKPGDKYACKCGVSFPVVEADPRSVKRAVRYLKKYPKKDRMLDIGCRKMRPKKGAVGIDLVPPDWVKESPERFCLADGRHLPFPNRFFGKVRATHVFEHISTHNGENKVALREWWRVLRYGGTLHIKVPNMFAFCREYVEGRWTVKTFILNTYGMQHRPGEFHFQGYDDKGLVKIVKKTLGRECKLDSMTTGKRGLFKVKDFELRAIFKKEKKK